MRIVLIAAALVLFTLPARAQCLLEAGSVEVSVKRTPVQIRYHNGYNRHQIAALQGGAPGGGFQQIGLTVAAPNYRLKVNTRHQQNGRGQLCSVLTAAHATISIPQLDVYITNEYRKGSCLYKAVLQHELKHVDILRTGLEEMVAQMRETLGPAAARAGVSYAPTQQAAIAELTARVQKYMQPIFQAWQQENARSNQALDAKESYISEHELCAQLKR